MLDLGDIQALALRALHHPHARHLFLQIEDARRARAWLGQTLPSVTSAAAADRQPPAALSLAFTAPGLAALGLREPLLASFPEEFLAGCAARAARIGDTGRNAPERWHPALRGAAPHLLASISAATPQERERSERALAAASGGLRVLGSQDADALPGAPPGGRIEHFGFRVGIGQPALEGDGLEALPGQGAAESGRWRLLKPGEFILGAVDETGAVAPLPQPEALSRNGSFVVLRVLHQDVAAFRAFLRANAASGGGEERVAAALLGRWRSGAPLALAPERDDPALALDPQRSNAFDFADDPRGVQTPLGAHIRRMNPRAGSTGSPVVSVHRHRLLQRGLSYGPPLPEGAADDGAERGVVILLVNSSIARQFEFVQAAWANGGDFVGLGSERDPVMGASDAEAIFTIPRRPLRLRLHELPAFTAVRGGAYCFLPSLRGLRFLAELSD